MLAVGSLPAHAHAHARLQGSEVYSFTRGEGCGEPRLDLGTFLPLRARVRERFPATAQLSDMQLLMLVTAPTPPWPLALDDTGIYGTAGERYSEYSGALLPTLATQFRNVEDMPGHPQAPAGTPKQQPKRDFGGFHKLREAGIPAGLELDNSCTGDAGYRYLDGLPIGMTLNKKLRGVLEEKLALVARFHRGGR